MLAVIPFENLTGDPAQEYFSDGMTEEMITQLGNLDPQHLSVIARTSVMRYRKGATPLRQIADELGVKYVLEGSVRRNEDKLRITVQLIQANDQTHVWAHEYDRGLKDLLVVQGEIAQEVADEMQLTLDEHAHPPAAARPALSPQEYEGYDLYLKGQFFLSKRNIQAFKQAIGYFEQATAKAPDNARAYAGLADSYSLLSVYSLSPPADVVAKARAAALRALQIDPGLPDAHTALALVVENNDWDWNTAEREFQRAIELNPNYATAHHWYAELLMWRGRFDEALQQMEHARQLDPLSLIIAADKGAILYYSRQYDRAIEQFKAVLELEPNFMRAQVIMPAYVEKGMLAEALAVMEKQRSITPVDWYWTNRAYLYGRSGEVAQARRALEELLRLNRTERLDPAAFVFAYAGMGDKEQALAWLEKAYAQHSTAVMSLKINPGYDALRDDPRFQALLRRTGLGR